MRQIRCLTDAAALSDVSAEFEAVYATIGCPAIPPEKLLRALLLQAFYSIRSERQLIERLDYNLLFRWFVGLSMDEPVWDASVCNKNRDRLLEADIAAAFLAAVLNLAEMKLLLSTEHFTVGRHADGLAHLKRRGFAPKSIIDVGVLYGTHELYEAFPGARLFLFGPNPNRPQDQVLDFVDLVFVRKNSRLRPQYDGHWHEVVRARAANAAVQIVGLGAAVPIGARIMYGTENSTHAGTSWQPTCRPLPAGKSPCHEPKERYTGQFVFA